MRKFDKVFNRFEVHLRIVLGAAGRTISEDRAVFGEAEHLCPDSWSFLHSELGTIQYDRIGQT